MLKLAKAQLGTTMLTVALLGYACGPVAAAVRIEGQVLSGRWPARKLDRDFMGRKHGRSQAIGSNKIRQ